MRDRRKFYRSLISGWLLLVMLIAWSVLSNRDTVLSVIKAVVPDNWDRWLEQFFMLQNWPWYVWAIGSLAILAGYILESGYKRFRAERDRADALQESMKPKLEILWKPGEETYVMPYPEGSSNPTRHHRVCIKNTSTLNAVDDIVVTLDKLVPYVLNCVPCPLRLTNNILMEPNVDPKKESFPLNAGGRQFIDVFEHNPGAPNFSIWHTVVPQIPTHVPAREYKLTIGVTARNAPAISKNFEIFKNGAVWDMRDANGVS
jgi:hypothetical protein